jgi:hypothetical protein
MQHAGNLLGSMLHSLAQFLEWLDVTRCVVYACMRTLLFALVCQCLSIHPKVDNACDDNEHVFLTSSTLKQGGEAMHTLSVCFR